MLDLLIKQARLADGRVVDVAVQGEMIAAVQSDIEASAQIVIEAHEQLLSSPFVDSHFHMDSTLTAETRASTSPERCWRGLVSGRTETHTDRGRNGRALALCRWSIAWGTLAIRSRECQ